MGSWFQEISWKFQEFSWVHGFGKFPGNSRNFHGFMASGNFLEIPGIFMGSWFQEISWKFQEFSWVHGFRKFPGNSRNFHGFMASGNFLEIPGIFMGSWLQEISWKFQEFSWVHGFRQFPGMFLLRACGKIPGISWKFPVVSTGAGSSPELAGSSKSYTCHVFCALENHWSFPVISGSVN